MPESVRLEGVVRRVDCEGMKVAELPESVRLALNAIAQLAIDNEANHQDVKVDLDEQKNPVRFHVRTYFHDENALGWESIIPYGNKVYTPEDLGL